jgi:hypothetical protein
MNTLITFALIYLVGCLLSYWRMLATIGHIVREKTIWGFLKSYAGAPGFYTALSWIGFAIGTFWYFDYEDKYFFKFHVRDYQS